jgi:hypothetical protein
MANSPCPICPKDGRLLQSSTENSSVTYYRCDYCGHVWSHEKRDPDSPAKAVTDLRKSPPEIG